jgi:hypothetical protein
MHDNISFTPRTRGQQIARKCFQTWFVILNAVKNPSELGSLPLDNEYPSGFFAALRMTGFEYFRVLKLHPVRLNSRHASQSLRPWFGVGLMVFSS